METSEVVLEKIRLACVQHLSGTLLDVDAECYMDFVTQNVVLRVEGAMLGERMGSRSVCWPANWREAFKERWFPAWALRRWPVRRTTYTFSAAACYPDFKPAIPDQRVVWITDGSFSEDDETGPFASKE